MTKAFDFKAMGRPSYMIGLHLQHETTCLRISQRQYILDASLGKYSGTRSAYGYMRILAHIYAVYPHVVLLDLPYARTVRAKNPFPICGN